jgi:hypothetical protein
MPCPLHSPWFDLPNDIGWWVQIMKLPTMQLSPFSRYFIPLRSKYSQHPVLKHPQPMLFLNVRDQVSYPYKRSGRIMVLCICTSTFASGISWYTFINTLRQGYSTCIFFCVHSETCTFKARIYHLTEHVWHCFHV